ncbi:MAG: hypothetical protein PVG07_15715, partial [Acidobacteriota bacterium]
SIGTLLGEAAVNIADAHLGRERSADDAWTVLRLDQNPDDETLGRLRALPRIHAACGLDLGSPGPGFGDRESRDRRTPPPGEPARSD